MQWEVTAPVTTRAHFTSWRTTSDARPGVLSVDFFRRLPAGRGSRRDGIHHGGPAVARRCGAGSKRKDRAYRACVAGPDPRRLQNFARQGSDARIDRCAYGCGNDGIFEPGARSGTGGTVGADTARVARDRWV